MDAKTYDKLEELLRRVKAIEAGAGDMETDGLYRAIEGLQEVLWNDDPSQLSVVQAGLERAAVELYAKEHPEFGMLLEEIAKLEIEITRKIKDHELERILAQMDPGLAKERIEGIRLKLANNPGEAIIEAIEILSFAEEKILKAKWNLGKFLNSICTHLAKGGRDDKI